jgi:hypothetical protein
VCDRGNIVTLWHPDIGRFDVDQCIAPVVEALNSWGIRTVASCCGHGQRPGNIALADGRELIIAADFETGREIDAAFPSINGDLPRSKVIPSIVTFCKEVRPFCAQTRREEATQNGWNAELGYHHVQFDLCGTILERLGESDDLNWARDALGVDRPGAEVPSLKALEMPEEIRMPNVGADGWPRSL